ncbi:MAG: histidine kinase [Gammaproteobacteria bacterium]|nr:histidine kinase [Gammaproteobacteria bacterium]
MTPQSFQRRFMSYILLAWTLPPVLGMAFILFIHLLTPGQVGRILTAPVEPAFILGTLVFALVYFHRFMRPIRDYLAAPGPDSGARALARMRRFPLDFWTVFLVYLLLAPATVMLSAIWYTDYAPVPVDWFRIHLVALIVSIIVGLPIFFRVLDLFGQSLEGLRLERPHVTLRTKVFLIGALVPLLIDTMLVQYYWTRTGFFTVETFFMWLLLEILAIAGSLIFVRSFGQALAPLQQVVRSGLNPEVPLRITGGHSTDELGVLADDFRVLLDQRSSLERRLAQEKELAQVTLSSIGDGVITTDMEGRVRFLNPIAEYLTGWKAAQAQGRPLTEVFRIINELTRRPAVDPVERCLREGRIVGLANHTILVRTDGHEFAIEDSAAPIRDNDGSIIGVVLVFHDVTKAREMANRLSWQASHDALTSLYNRMAFEERLRQLVRHPEHPTGEDQHTLLYIDLDQFKVVNDIAGHTAGDEMLKQISGLMLHQMRDTDMLARLGGDEFGVILTHCDLDHAMRVADGIHQALEDFKFSWDERLFRVGASIGVLEFRPGETSLTDLMSAADLACYSAKHAGRRRTHVYQVDDVHMQRHRNEMDWAARINDAVEEDRLVLYGQRIRRLDNGHPSQGQGLAFEVLVRMRGDDDTLIAPGVFLPAAERFDLISIVDRWIITRAFSLVAECVDAHGTDCIGHCALNLSGGTLGDETLLPFIQSQLSLHGLPGHLFCFEITETTAISNFKAALRFIRDLKAMGCRFALDDFGSGLSSFSYLKNLPVDYLKIDGTFVRGIATDPVNRTLVGNINDIGHLLGKQTIAEYAEDEATLKELIELGVDYAQGYGIHRPEPLEHLLDPPR